MTKEARIYKKVKTVTSKSGTGKLNRKEGRKGGREGGRGIGPLSDTIYKITFK